MKNIVEIILGAHTKNEGVPAENVAEVIVKTAEETLGKTSGDDVNVEGILEIN